MQKKSRKDLFKLISTIAVTTVLSLTSMQAASSGKTTFTYQKALNDAAKVAAMNDSWTVMRGAGNSMLPLYGENSVLVVEKASFSQLSTGMVAVYKDSEGSLVAHTLTAKADSGWIAKGINNKSQDPEKVSAENFVGVVFGVFNAFQSGQESVAQISAQEIPVVYGKTF